MIPSIAFLFSLSMGFWLLTIILSAENLITRNNEEVGFIFAFWLMSMVLTFITIANILEFIKELCC